MILIHPIHLPPAIFCMQIEHYQAAIREFSSLCVSSCTLVNQEKTKFQKLKTAMTDCVMTLRHLSWDSSGSVGHSTNLEGSPEAHKMSTILSRVSVIHLAETEV